MSDTHTLTTREGRTIQIVDELAGSGTMKEVYFSPDRSYAVGFYRGGLEGAARERLDKIVGTYRERIFTPEEGDYWRNIFCWPTDLVEVNGRIGLVMPTYHPAFFFSVGSRNGDMLSLRGREKEGKWFASPKHRKKYLAPEELGDWRNHLAALVKLSRGVRRLHMAGLAHSDLSYKNVLLDPTSGRACIIDIDGLVVPGKYPPDVVGTPDFIAPEVVRTSHLPMNDPDRALPSIATDRYAIAVLAYMYLLYRHPLKGRKIHDMADSVRDESLRMGERALFVEHPDDPSNRPGPDELLPDYLPWADVDAIPYTVTGPYLAPLFERTFISGLHDPKARTTTSEWETALVKTADLLQPCVNPACEQKWFVFDGAGPLACPFCGAAQSGQRPLLELFSQRGGRHHPDGRRISVHDKQYLFPWHVDRTIVPGEKVQAHHKRPVGYFAFHRGRWVFVNQTLPGLRDLAKDEPIPPGKMVILEPGQRLLLSPGEGGRLAEVRLVP